MIDEMNLTLKKTEKQMARSDYGAPDLIVDLNIFSNTVSITLSLIVHAWRPFTNFEE